MKKKIGPAVALALLAALVTFYLNRGPAAPEPGPAPTPAAPSSAPLPSSLSAQDTRAVEACLGERPADLNALEASLRKRLGDPRPRLSWRVITAEEGGTQYRLRLAPEGDAPPGLKIFTVDREGLPDLLREEPRDGERKLEEFLADKTVRSDIRSEELSSSDGSRLRLEKEGDALVEMEYIGPSSHLACSTKEGRGCRCL